jgi:hypothetical protein
MAAVKASIGSPAELNLSHYRNDSIDDFEIHITNKADDTDFDLSSYDEILMQIKNDAEETTSIIVFSKADGSILWSVDAGGLETGDGTDGKIVLRKNMTLMEVLGAGDFVYDIQFIRSLQSKRNTLVFGTFKVTADRTR